MTYNHLKQTGGWAGLSHYRYILTRDRHFKMALKNTAIYAGVSIVSLTALGFFAAAALNSATRSVKGVRMLMLFPYATSMTAVAMIFLLLYDKQLGLVNKALSLFGIAKVGWLEDPEIALYSLIYLAGMQSVPKELDDAAAIDGCGRFSQFVRIYLPLSGPVLASLGVLKFTGTWNEYMWPLVMTSGEELRTVQIALTMFRDESEIKWNLLMAATIVGSLPIYIVFFFAQKHFVSGLLAGSVKG